MCSPVISTNFKKFNSNQNNAIFKSGPSCFVACSPYTESPGFIAYGNDSKTSVLMKGICSSKELAPDSESDQQKLETWDFSAFEIGNASQITAFAWSPQSLSPTPENPYRDPCLSFCTASGDFFIRYYSVIGQNQENSTNFKEKAFAKFGGHKSYINSCNFGPQKNQNLLASTGDDYTCRIWDIETEKQISMLTLQSPGRFVKWSSSIENQVLIAEECGVIKFHDTRSKTVTSRYLLPDYIGDFDYVDQDNLSLFGCLSSNKWTIWQKAKNSNSYFPNSKEFQNPIQYFRINPQNPSYFATCSSQPTTPPQGTIWCLHSLPSPISFPLIGGDYVSGISWFGGNQVSDPTLVLSVGDYLNFWTFDLFEQNLF